VTFSGKGGEKKSSKGKKKAVVLFAVIRSIKKLIVKRVASTVLFAFIHPNMRDTMNLITKIVPMDFNYFLFGDAHMGSIFHNYRAWELLVDTIHSKIDGMPTKRNLCTEHGDDADFIDPKDPRMDLDAFDERQTLLQQLEYCKKARSAIKSHYVTKLIGNHEWAKMHIGKHENHNLYRRRSEAAAHQSAIDFEKIIKNEVRGCCFAKSRAHPFM
jgi:hypothetical protein